MTTIFSKIISGDIPSYKVYEDEDVYAFLDINPINKGHTLVVPKKEVDQLFDLDADTYERLMRKTKIVADLLKMKLNCKRVCMLVEGFLVPHAHVHLVPANEQEDFVVSNAHPATKEELEAVHSLLVA